MERITRRELIGLGFASVATASVAAEGFLMGRAYQESEDSPDQTITNSPKAPAGVDLSKPPSYRTLTERMVKGEKVSLAAAFTVTVNLVTPEDPSRLYPHDRVEQPQLAEAVDLYRINTTETGDPVFQLDLGLPILRKIPLSRLDFSMSDGFFLLVSPNQTFSMKEVGKLLADQNPAGTEKTKLSLFFYKFDPQKGMLTDNQRSIFTNALAITESFSDVEQENFQLEIMILHEQNPHFEEIGQAPDSVWRDTADVIQALQIEVRPKDRKPLVYPTVPPVPPGDIPKGSVKNA